MARFDHVWLLVAKNLKIKRRRWAVAVEIVGPIVFFLIGAFVRLSVPPTAISEEIFPDDDIVPTKAFIAANATGIPLTIGFSPNAPWANSVMRTFKREAEVVIASRGLPSVVHVEGFPDELSMVSAARRQPSQYLANVAFEYANDSSAAADSPPAQQMRYTIRMCPDCSPKTTQQFARRLGSSYGPNPRVIYGQSGFLLVQRLVDAAIASEIAGVDLFGSMDIAFVRYPYPPYLRNRFAQGLGSILPLFMVLSWLLTVAMIVRDVVYEKEHRLREAMRMMGTSGAEHTAAWWITALSTVIVSVVIMTVLAKGGRVLAESDVGAVLVFFLLAGVASIAFAFMMSSFFTRANVGAAAGGVLYPIAYIPFLFVSNPNTYPTLQKAPKLFLCLLAPSCLGIGGQVFADFEERGVGVSFPRLQETEDYDGGVSLAEVYGMLIFDTLLYMLIAWYVDNVWPGHYGVGRPWNFFMTRSYWCGAKAKHSAGVYPSSAVKLMSVKADSWKEDPALVTDVHVPAGQAFTPICEPLPSGARVGVRIESLCKTYAGAKKAAVDNLCLDMCEGEITSLLGRNGAGKSTTIALLTGLFTPTSGDAIVHGSRITQDMDAVRASLGLCPQTNVLFEALTVEEHLAFFCRLKGVTHKDAVAAEVDAMVADLNLAEKRRSRAHTLSGGMKRKLCVGIALIGGSKFVLLDEPTAGMDPQARRDTWDLIIKNRHGRTIVLTTHHMDEADVLGDRIAIMAGGRLQCAGSPLFLKAAFGLGYHLTVVKKDDCDAHRVTATVHSFLAAAKLISDSGSELSYLLPSDDRPLYASLFRALDMELESLHVVSYGLALTTMEEVFLRVNEDASAREECGAEECGGDDGDRDWPAKAIVETVVIDEESAHTLPVDSPPACAGTACDATPPMAGKVAPQDALCTMPQQQRGGVARLSPGWRLTVRQAVAVFVKHGTEGVRDRKAVCAQLLAPVLFVLFAMVVAKAYPPPDSQPPLGLTIASVPAYALDGSSVGAGFPYGRTVVFQGDSMDAKGVALGAVAFMNSPTSNPFSSQWGSRANAPNFARELNGSAPSDMRRELLQTYNAKRNKFSSYGSFSVAQRSGGGGLNITVWYQNEAIHSSPILVNALTNALLLRANRTLSVGTTNHPLPQSADIRLDELNGQGTQFSIAVLFIFGMAFQSSYFVGPLVVERANGIKRLQFLAGCTAAPYWVGTLACDLVGSLASLGAVCIIIAAFGIPAYTGVNLGAIALLLLAYSVAEIGLMYVVSFLFRNPTSSYVTMTVANVLVGLATVVAVWALEVFEVSAGAIDTLKWAFLVFPPYAMGRGIVDIVQNSMLNDFRVQFSLGDGSDPLAWAIAGRNVVFLVASAFVYFVLVFAIEGKWFRCMSERSKRRLQDALLRRPVSPDEDMDVQAERARVACIGSVVGTAGGVEDAVVVRGLAKVYSGEGGDGARVAVDGLWCGMRRGECFGLLGVNGAGKTTTFGMITGALEPTSGDVRVCGHSVVVDPALACRNIGYCPQSDALMDSLTARELLLLFSRIRGIAQRDEDAAVNALLVRLELVRYADICCGVYSGGNKRKLSAAIALVGSPPVVFFDEPTAGVDAKARHFLLGAIGESAREGACVVLTSHSMEECEALCNRLAIMVDGRFQCHGSVQHIKNRFGAGYEVAVQTTAPIGLQEDMVDTLVLDVPPAESEANEENAVPYHRRERDCESSRAIEKRLSGAFPSARLVEAHNGWLFYEIADMVAGSLVDLFSVLENALSDGAVVDYSVSQTTLERVFIRFASATATRPH